MDAMVEDRFAETLDSCHRFAHEVLKNYSFYVNSSAQQRLDLLDAANPVEAEDGDSLLEAGSGGAGSGFSSRARTAVKSLSTTCSEARAAL
jgi:hypothetical protein